MVTQTVTDTVLDLKSELQEKKAVEKKLATKLGFVEQEHKKQLEESENQVKQALSKVRDVSQERDQV